jgi:hypothetical protein
VGEVSYFSAKGWGVVTFLDGKKEKLEDNSVKRAILTTFSATKAQKPLKRGYNYLFDKKKGKLFFTVFFRVLKRAVLSLVPRFSTRTKNSGNKFFYRT